MYHPAADYDFSKMRSGGYENCTDSFLMSIEALLQSIKNIFDSGELDRNSACANFAQAADDGKTYKSKFVPPDFARIVFED